MTEIPVTPVAGYRKLTQEDIDLMNENKLIEELVLRQVDRHVRQHGSTEIDQRFVSIARTHIQEGFMALNRAVAQPTRITPDTTQIEHFEMAAEDLVAKLLRKV
jgi:predicted N-acyltransferase